MNFLMRLKVFKIQKFSKQKYENDEPKRNLGETTQRSQRKSATHTEAVRGHSKSINGSLKKRRNNRIWDQSGFKSAY